MACSCGSTCPGPTSGYQDIAADKVTLLTSAAADTVLRVIAGDIDGHRGPGSTRTPMAMVHATLAPDGQAVVPWPAEFNCLV
jgi:hypothetical protein